jgi:hypothetical protein
VECGGIVEPLSPERAYLLTFLLLSVVSAYHRNKLVEYCGIKPEETKLQTVQQIKVNGAPKNYQNNWDRKDYCPFKMTPKHILDALRVRACTIVGHL